jgi:hypothetical protein
MDSCSSPSRSRQFESTSYSLRPDQAYGFNRVFAAGTEYSSHSHASGPAPSPSTA